MGVRRWAAAAMIATGAMVLGPGVVAADEVADAARPTAAPLVDPVLLVDPGPGFSDVPVGHPFFEDVAWLAASGITGGYDDGTFRPGGTVSRQAMAAFLYRLVDPDGFVAPTRATFRDVPRTHPFFTEIEWLHHSGVAGGYDDRTFRPGGTVTRQAMAAFLFRLMNPIDFWTPQEATFTDAPPDKPFFEEIEWLAWSGVTGGYEDGTFRPSRAVSRQAMAAFLHRFADQLRAEPVPLPVGAGGSHTLAVVAGQAHAWGSNGYGQLGDGTTTGRPAPAPVPGLADVVQVSAGDAHSLALTADGGVYAWGRNDHGQVGDGTHTARSAPVRLTGLPAMVWVEAGDYHSLAVSATGGLYAWGHNGHGQLGDGTTISSPTPVLVPGLPRVVAVAAGYLHTLVLTAEGEVLAGGANSDGRLGMGDLVGRTSPERVPGLTGVVRVEAGVHHSLAVTASGEVYAWGANDSGQLGDGSTANRLTPQLLAGVPDVTAVAAGWWHSVASTAAGQAYAWGGNGYGQLGDGSGGGRSVPGPVPEPTDVVALSGGDAHTVALTATGEIWSWGRNTGGQLGDGTTVDRPLPVLVTFPDP